MRRMKRYVALILSLLLLISVESVWASEPESSGMYHISDACINTIRTASDYAVEAIKVDGFDGDYYPGAVRFNVTCPDAKAGEEYVIFVVEGAGPLSASNIVYVNQQKAVTNGSLTFSNVYPSKLEEQQYSVYVTGADKDASSPLATFFYHLVQQFALRLKLFGVDTSGVSVTLFRNDDYIDAAFETNSSSFFFPRLDSGSQYGVYVQKSDYVPFYSGFALDADTELIVPMVVPGDLNGTPESNGDPMGISDLQALYEYLSQRTSVVNNPIFAANADYFHQVCNYNGDDAVNILDYQAMYEAITNANLY